MKNSIKILLINAIFLVFAGNTADAQFFKKLKKSVEDKVEEKIINKTSDKAVEKTDKTMDEVFNQQMGGGKKSKKVEPTNIQSSYPFEYQYRLTMTNKQLESSMNMDYFLKPGASYMGLKMNLGPEMFMIMDGETNINYMFMNVGDTKMVTATAIDGDDLTPEGEYDYEGYTFTDLPNKTFLGYDCVGKKMENKEYIFIMYFTNDAPITFNDVFKVDTDRLPAAIKNQFSGNEKGTMMFMDMKDKLNKGKKDKSGTMECTLLEPADFIFDASGYKSM